MILAYLEADKLCCPTKLHTAHLLKCDHVRFICYLVQTAAMFFTLPTQSCIRELKLPYYIKGTVSQYILQHSVSFIDLLILVKINIVLF